MKSSTPGRWSGTGSAEVEGPTSFGVFIVMVGLTRMLYA